MDNWTIIQNTLKFGNTKLATGYYAQINNYIKKGYTPVPISIVPPKWFPKEYDFKINLSPNNKILSLYKNNKINNDEYIYLFYNEILNKLNPKTIIHQLANISHRIVLLCYEKPFTFCHRHIVNYWLSHNLNFEINEITL